MPPLSHVSKEELCVLGYLPNSRSVTLFFSYLKGCDWLCMSEASVEHFETLHARRDANGDLKLHGISGAKAEILLRFHRRGFQHHIMLATLRWIILGLTTLGAPLGAKVDFAHDVLPLLKAHAPNAIPMAPTKAAFLWIHAGLC